MQTSFIFAALIYAEFTNCLMYIGPTSVVFDNFCAVLCIVPMLTTAMVECRLFAYFLLMKERLQIINQSIDFFQSNLGLFPDVVFKNTSGDKIKDVRSEIFFIAELGSLKINERVKAKSDNGSKSNFETKLKSMMSTFWRFIKNSVNTGKNKLFANNFEAAYKRILVKNNYDSHDYVHRVCSMQLIYTQLCETSDLISSAYGIQIIVIITVQFITLSTLLYYTSMKIIRWGIVGRS